MPTFKIHFTPAAEALLTEKPRPTNWADVEKLADEFEARRKAELEAEVAAHKAEKEALRLRKSLRKAKAKAEAEAEAETEAAAGAGAAAAEPTEAETEEANSHTPFLAMHHTVNGNPVCFSVFGSFLDVKGELAEELYPDEPKTAARHKLNGLLQEPCGYTSVLLLSNWGKRKYRMLDFTGLTNGLAIQKILTFYEHKTIRRMVGDHQFFEGFSSEWDDDARKVVYRNHLGS